MIFSNKVVIVTGASSGIGKQVSIDLAKKDSVIIMLARNKNNLEKAFNEVSQYSPNSSYFVCDVSNEKQVSSAVKKIYEKYRKIDILINNAGFGIYKTFMDSTLDEIKSQMDTNYYGSVYFIKHTAEIMKKQNFGHIVNISSVAGKSGYPNVAAYCASKFAVIGLSEALYAELKSHNINVSVVCPGSVSTNFFSHPSWKNFPHEKRHKSMLSASQVSKAIIKALATKKFEIIVPFRSKIILLGKEILKEKYVNILSKLPRE